MQNQAEQDQMNHNLHPQQAPHHDVTDTPFRERGMERSHEDRPAHPAVSATSAHSAPAPSVNAPSNGVSQNTVAPESALPPTSTKVRLSTPQNRAWKVEGGRLVIDHAAENIRHVLQEGIDISGEMSFNSGGLAFGGRHRSGMLRVSDGTLIVLDGAIIEADIEAVNVYNLGTIASSHVRASGLLVNWGKLNGGSIEYGALENYGEVEGHLTKIKA